MTTKFQPLHPSPWYQSLQKPLRARWLVGLLLLGGMAGGGFGLYHAVAPSQNVHQTLTVPVEQQSLPITLSANGTVKAERTINLSPKSAGYLKQLLVKEGVQKNVEQQIQSLGTDVLQISPGAARSGNIVQSAGSLSTLTWEDAKAIAAGAPSAKLVSATLQQSVQVVYGGANTNTTVYGTDLNYPSARNTHPQTGRYFNQDELDGAAQVAVLGPTVQQKLFGNNTGLNEKIRIQGGIYRVIGIMEPKGSQGPMDRDDTIYIPLTTMSSRIVGNNALKGVSVNTILVKGENQNALVAAQFQVTNILRLRHNIYNPDNDDFRVMNQADLINTFSNVIGVLTILVVAIASISLVVGGIGIANIMLVSVVERTREIGIRKALGATHWAILTQFLIEAIAISTIGGVIGAGGGILIAFGSSLICNFPFVVSSWSITIGFVLSTGVGLVAGVIPARNAALLDPIAALRSE